MSELNMCPFCGNSIRSSDNATHCPACREFNRMRDRIADLEQKLASALERGKVMETALLEIAGMEAGSHEPPTEMSGCMTSESCDQCQEMIDIARMALSDDK